MRAITRAQIRSLAINVVTCLTTPAPSSKPRQEAGSSYMYFARPSRAHVTLCGFARMWTIFGALGPARDSSAWPDDFKDGKKCLMQPGRQPTPRPLPRKDSRLTVRLCAITGTQIQSLAISVGARSSVPSTHLKPRQEAGALFIYFARTSRAHVALCGCVRMWTVFGSLDPDKGCFCMAGQLQKWEAVSHAVREAANNLFAAAKSCGLDRQTAYDNRNADAELGDKGRVVPGGAEDALEGEARSRGTYIFFGRVPRTRALPCTECTDLYERVRILHEFRAAVARAVYGGPGGSADLGSRSNEADPIYILRARFAHARVAVYGMYGSVRTCTDSAGIPRGRCTSGVRGASRKRRPRQPEQGAGPHTYTSGAFRARARCRVRIVRILHDLCAVVARAVYENRGGSPALRGRGGLRGSG